MTKTLYTTNKNLFHNHLYTHLNTCIYFNLKLFCIYITDNFNYICCSLQPYCTHILKYMSLVFRVEQFSVELFQCTFLFGSSKTFSYIIIIIYNINSAMREDKKLHFLFSYTLQDYLYNIMLMLNANYSV